nr:unnamed protein product [Spirometra erinaceieuropaei]
MVNLTNTTASGQTSADSATTAVASETTPSKLTMKATTGAGDSRCHNPGLLLQAVNTSPNATFGTWSLSPDIRLRGLFPWVFVVSDMPCVILGADFDLLVDCRQLRLQDQTTKLSLPDIPDICRPGP